MNKFLLLLRILVKRRLFTNFHSMPKLTSTKQRIRMSGTVKKMWSIELISNVQSLRI